MNAKLILRHAAICGLAVCLMVICNYNAFAQSTTLWLVRHAEKSADNPTDRDPALSSTGQQRAVALAEVLAVKSIYTIYSTNYKRTMATAAPLAAMLKLTPVFYNPNDAANIAQKAIHDNAGKNALIIGHSNTLIPILKALNCQVPFDELNDNDYDLLLRVVIDDKGKAALTISYYGAKHHTTEIPDKYLQQ